MGQLVGVLLYVGILNHAAVPAMASWRHSVLARWSALEIYLGKGGCVSI
jgi:hypothetical protein